MSPVRRVLVVEDGEEYTAAFRRLGHTTAVARDPTTGHAEGPRCGSLTFLSRA